MWKFYVLSILIVLLAPNCSTRQEQRRLFDKGKKFRRDSAQRVSTGTVSVTRWIPKRPPHASLVPFWQYPKMEEFTCQQAGYFPFSRNCKYFNKCVVLVLDQLFRFVYKCEGDRVFSIEKESCVLPEENEKVDCGGVVEETEGPSMIEGQGNQDDEKEERSGEMVVEPEIEESDNTTDLMPLDEEELLALDYLQSNESEEISTTEENLTVEKETTMFPIRLTTEETMTIREAEDSQETLSSTMTNLFEDNPSNEEVDLASLEQVDEESTRSEETDAPESSENQDSQERNTTADRVTEEEDTGTKGETEENALVSITSSWMEQEYSTESTQEMIEEPESSTPFTSYDEGEDSGCIEEGFFSVPDDCSKFYRCIPFGYSWMKYEFTCPYGTIWDDRLKTCNFRAAIEHITCKDKRISVASTTELPAGGIEIICPIKSLPGDRIIVVCPTGFRRHPKYCNVFYQCIVHDSMRMSFMPFLCPKDTIFDEEHLQCTKNESSDQNCTIYESMGELDSIRIMNISNTELCPKEGRFSYSESCSSQYLECTRNERGILEGYLLSCPRGQMYSFISKKCMPLSFFLYCPPDPLE